MYSRGSQELQLPNLVIWAFLLCPASLPRVSNSFQSNGSFLSSEGQKESSPGILSRPPPLSSLTLCSVMEKKRD